MYVYHGVAVTAHCTAHQCTLVDWREQSLVPDLHMISMITVLLTQHRRLRRLGWRPTSNLAYIYSRS